MITVITGLPGNGKTLWAIAWVKAKAEKEGREVFYSGIADLKLPWTEIDPTKWFEAPPGSIIVIDEAQRVFRPRHAGNTVPDYVAKLETHRHNGHDLVLITQHPMLIESNVRRLSEQHFHSVRMSGAMAATVHEFSPVRENCDKNREGSTKHVFKYPKELFGLYRSAEVHTHKFRFPRVVLVLAAVPVLIGLAAWRVYSHWAPGSESRVVGKSVAAGPGLAAPGGTPSAPTKGQHLSRDDYLAAHTPRVPGLAYTAPVYDSVTEPKYAPYPAAVIASKDRCKAYSQQGTVLAMSDELCRSIAASGFFVPWDDEGSKVRDKREGSPSVIHAGTAVYAGSSTLGGHPGPGAPTRISVNGHGLPPQGQTPSPAGSGYGVVAGSESDQPAPGARGRALPKPGA